MRSFIILLFVFVGSSLYTVAQNSQWQQFGVRDGLPQSNITSITQDDTGYLWLGTKGSGLVRFDGKNYKVFSLKDSLKSNFISDLHYTKDTLYIATHQGLGVYSNGRIAFSRTPKINKIKLINNELYLATDSGLYQWKGNYTLPVKIDYAIDFNKVNDIEYHNSLYWIATKNGLWYTNRLNTSNKIVKRWKGNFTSLLSTPKKLLASEFSEGIYQVETHIFILKKEIKNLSQIKKVGKEVWALTSNKGFQKFSSDLELNIPFSNSDLKSENIQDVYIDNSSRIWVATESIGLFKFTQNNFEHYATNNSGLSNNKINAIASDSLGIWIASGNGNLELLTTNSLFVKSGIDELQNTKINSIAIDISNHIWLATQNKGLLLLKKTTEKDSTNQFPKYKLIDIGNQLKNIGKSVKHIVTDDNKIWLSDYDQIHLLTTNDGIVKKTESFGKNQGIKDPEITGINVFNKQLWYTTKSGNLGFYNGHNFVEYYQVTGKKIPIISLAHKNSQLFLGTLGDGIWVCTKQNPKEAYKLPGEKKLNSQNIQQLLVDKKGVLWVGTEKGLNKVILENNAIEDVFYFSKNDGFLGIETVPNVISEDSIGNLWFGTKNGITKLNNGVSTKNKLTPKIKIERLDVNLNRLDTININNYDSTLPLSSDQNSISFHYKTVDLDNAEDVEYLWKLNDKISNWNKNENINFAKLDYGSYTFSVKSRNRDWLESNTIQFQFYIKKPWYLQNWLLIVSGIIFLAILTLIIWNYIEKIKARSKEKIEKLSLQNQLISLEQKALQLQMNPHFVFNVLNSIKAYGSSGKITKMNETISEFAVLLRGILQNSRVNFVPIKSELEIVKNYCLLEQKLTRNSFEILFDLKLNSFDEDEILIPSMIIQPFIENSIKHGFKNISYKGIITLSLEVKDDVIVCLIKDNGVGYNTSIKEKKTQHKSVALEVTKDRLKGIVNNPNFSIKEIKEDNKVKGTLVTFNLPYKTDF